MSGYKGPRGPNVSQYIANLNQLSPVTEALAEPQPTSDDFSAFLNTDFFDINGGTNVDLTAPIDFGVDFDIKSSAQPTAENSPRPSFSAPSASTKPGMDFNLNADFQFTDFPTFNAAPILDTSMPALSQTYPLPAYAPPPSAISPLGGYDDASRKRKASDDLDLSIGTPNLHLDESARGAAEEDKRRRNTAASARFRVKKKQREQALEKTAKEMSDRVQQLEARIGQLETENTWLKSLITEKSAGKSSSSDIKALLSKHEEKKATGRSSPAHTEGVGTSS